MKRPVRAALLLLCAHSLFSQHHLEPEEMHQRIICVVPMVGKGTFEDPRRPMFTPIESKKENSTGKSASRSGIIGYAYEISDDGQSAIVEFVAADQVAFKEILEAKEAGVKAFRKINSSDTELLTELRRYRKDLDLKKLRVGVQ